MNIDKMAGSLAEHFVDGKYKKALKALRRI